MKPVDAAHNVTMATNIQTSVQQTVTLTDVGQLGMELGLDSGFTQIIGMSLAAIQGIKITNPTTSLQSAFNQVLPDIKRSFTQYGIDKLGQSLGLSTSLSSALSYGITSALDSFYLTSSAIGSDLMQAVNQGIASGVVKYGVEFAGNSNPVLGSLLSMDITRSVEAALGQAGLLQSAFSIIQRSAVNAINVVGGTVKTIFEGVKDFSSLIQEKGLAGAFESLGGSAFSPQASQAIYEQGGLQAMLNTAERTAVTLPNGVNAIELKIDANNSLYFNGAQEFIGRKSEGVDQLGVLGYSSTSGLGVLEGDVYADMGNGQILEAAVTDGQAEHIHVNDSQGEIVSITSTENEKFVYLQAPAQDEPAAAPSMWNSVLNLAQMNMSFLFDQGVAHAAEGPVISTAAAVAAQTQKFMYTLVNGIANPEPNPMIPPAYIQNQISNLATRSSHSISNEDIIPVPLYQPTVTQPIFKFTDLINQGIDAVKWAVESQVSEVRSKLTTQVIQVMGSFFWNSTDYSQLIRPMIAMGYSGGFMPLAEAIANQRYNVTTLVALGAATVDLGKDIPAVLVKILAAIEEYAVAKAQGHFNDLAGILQKLSGLVYFIKPAQDVMNQLLDAVQNNIESTSSLLANIISESKPQVDLVSLTNTKVQQILNIWGTEDVLYKFGIGGKRVNLCNKTTINVEIEGATHFDYMYRTTWDSEADRIWNEKVSNFVTDLIISSDDQDKITQFFDERFISRDSSGTYKVTRAYLQNYV